MGSFEPRDEVGGWDVGHEREVIEPGAASLAARRATSSDLEALDAALAAMRMSFSASNRAVRRADPSDAASWRAFIAESAVLHGRVLDASRGKDCDRALAAMQGIIGETRTHRVEKPTAG